MIIASYRDDQLDRTDPLRIMLGELPRSQTIARLKLAALSKAAVAQLASPHAVDIDELYRKTSGNPFFVIEALAAPGEEIPETVRDAVLRKLDVRTRGEAAAEAARLGLTSPLVRLHRQCR